MLGANYWQAATSLVVADSLSDSPYSKDNDIMRSFKFVIPCALLALANCNAVGQELSRFQKIENRVRERLRDPASARFFAMKEITFQSTHGPTTAVCGKVSARTGNGGMSGAILFKANDDRNQSIWFGFGSSPILLEEDVVGELMYVRKECGF